MALCGGLIIGVLIIEPYIPPFVIEKVPPDKSLIVSLFEFALLDKSKIAFMGGSLIHHGGQNPLEALARGCHIVSGEYNDNFKDQYLDLEKLKLASIVNSDTSHISSKINDLVDLNFDNSSLIVNYFKDNKKDLNKMIEMIQKC